MLIGVPIMLLRSLVASARAGPERDGDGFILRPSKASFWMAALCLIAPLGTLLRWRASVNEPDFSFFNDVGPMLALAAGVGGTLIALWLVWRWWRRTVRYDDEGVTFYGRRHLWDDLTEARIEHRTVHVASGSGIGRLKLPSSTTIARFADGATLRLTTDLEGRREFDKFLRRVAKRHGVKFEKRNLD